MKRKTVAVLTGPKLSAGSDIAGFGPLMKRAVVLLTVWAMALAGVLASAVFLPSSASAAVPTQAGVHASVAPAPLLDTRAGIGAVVARDAAGLLWLYPVNGAGVLQTRRQIGSGWNLMTALVTPGDVTGDGNTDVIARDTSGRLWLYPGTATGGLSVRRQIGSGWQSFTVTSASDMNRAGRPDLLARDSAGVLWLYPLSGNAVFGTRTKVGTGWNGFTIVGPGDVSGDGKADILARNTAGALWLFRGNGAGGVAKGTLVSGAWQGMTAFVGPGNWDRLLGNDLVARDAGGRLLLYLGNNAGGFGPARQITSGWSGMTFIGWSSNTTLAPPDVTPPGPVTALTATAASTTSIALHWVNPTATDYTGVTIRRALGSTAPATATSGTSVPVPTSATATSFTDIGLTASTQYSYAVFAHDGSLNNALPAKASATTSAQPDVTPPGPVTALTAAAASTTSIALHWVNPTATDFTGVTIRRAPGGTAPATVTDGTSVAVPASATATSFTDTALTASTQYSYAVFAHDGSLNNALPAKASATTSAQPDVTPPGPVTALTAAAASTTSIALHWVNPAATDYTGVTIRRAIGSTAPATVADGTSVPVPASATATSFTDTGLTASTQYSYAVFAHDGSLNNAIPAKVSATTSAPPDVTAPGPVTGLAATVASDSSIKLDWTNPTATDFTGVTIRRALGSTAPATVTDGTSVAVAASATATSFTDTGLTVGQQYSYAVFAHDGSGNNAAPANVTAATTTSSRPTAILSVNSSHGLTAKTSVGGFSALFDVSTSLAGTGSTLVSALLNYGDGTPPVSFSGDPATWLSSHDFATVGDKAVTVVITNSAGATATDGVTVTVYPMPTATITVVGPVVLGQPVTFDLTALTPAGTVLTDYDFCYDGTAGPIWDRGNGVPPTTTTHTFTAEGTYDAEFYVYNNADGWAIASIVVTVDATAPAPVTALTAAAGANSIALAWANPNDADFAGVTIRRLEGSSAPTLTTGTLVSDTAKTGTSFTDTGLALGTQYSYAAFAHDGSGNYAAAASVTGATVGVLPTATLSINGSIGATAKTSVGGFRPHFDLGGSLAGSGTLVSASLDYGDGTTQSFTDADPATWNSDHVYATSGDMAVTAVVTNSAGDTATTAVLVTVFAAPTAMITPPRIARPGDPLTLAVTASTPAGTTFTDYDVSYDNGVTWVYVSDVPPTTLTHTYSAEGTYTVLFDAYNDAEGWARSSAEVRVDITPPAPVTSPMVSAVSIGDTWLSLSWTNPADLDLTGVMIRRLAGATAPATVSDGVLVSDFNDRADYVINPDLTPGTQYSYAVFAHDGSGNYAAGVNVTGTTTGTPPQVTPPGPVTTLTAVALAGDTSMKLDWVNPTDSDFAGVTIRRALGATAPASAITGVSVTVPASATATSFTDTGLTPGTEYSYAVFSHDVAGNHAAAAKVTETTKMVTTAILMVDTRLTAGVEFFFDPALSYAAMGATLTGGTLDYGDSTTPEPFSGTADGWYAFHTFATAGTYSVTLTVTDSAMLTVSKVVTINVFDPPTASMPATAQAAVGVPFTFPFTATTPSGTAFQSWSLYGDWLAGGYGTAAPAATHTFTAAGTYSFTLTVTNDANGEAISSPMVVTVQ